MTKKNRDKLTNALNISIDYLKQTNTTLEPKERIVYLTKAKQIIDWGITVAENELMKGEKRNSKLKK